MNNTSKHTNTYNKGTNECIHTGNNIEIERKFTINNLPENLEQYDSHIISQAYLNNDPTIRIRRQDDDYYMTYKQKGLMSHTEVNLPLNKEAYEHMLSKADGRIISKTRYLIPIDKPCFETGFSVPDDLKLTIELDIFDAPFCPLVIAEIEFPDEATALAYKPEDWFCEDVTADRRYYNSYLVYNGYDPEQKN